MPKTAMEKVSPALASRVSTTRLGALKPPTARPPVSPIATGSSPFTHTSAQSSLTTSTTTAAPSSVCRSTIESGRLARSSGGPGNAAARLMASVAAISGLDLDGLATHACALDGGGAELGERVVLGRRRGAADADRADHDA